MSLNARPTPEDKSDSQSFRPKWLDPRPSPLAAAFTCLVIVVMFGLGSFIINDYRSLQLQSHGKLGSVYIDNLLAPYALSALGGAAEPSQEMEYVFGVTTEESSQLLMRIWRPDGTLFYSSFTSDSIELHDREDLDIALSGNFVAKLETSGVVDAGFPMSYPYFEIYAPIHDRSTGKMIAVGEIYKDASETLHDRAFVERAVWTAVTFVTLSMLAMLALSFSQSNQLKSILKVERSTTKQNRRLRRAADQARLEAAQANEQVLNLVGAELHDGPVQLLGLMSLMMGDDAHSRISDGTTLGSLTDQVMTELRGMSAGLILPELDDLDAGGVVALAVKRHRALTGREVDIDMDLPAVQLDGPRRICLYRVVQEGLSNAARHGGGRVPHVSLKSSGEVLEIMIRSGPSKPAGAVAEMPAWRCLGLHGMRRRLEVFGGTLVLDSTVGETSLHVTLPLNMPDSVSDDDVS